MIEPELGFISRLLLGRGRPWRGFFLHLATYRFWFKTIYLFAGLVFFVLAVRRLAELLQLDALKDVAVVLGLAVVPGVIWLQVRDIQRKLHMSAAKPARTAR